MGRPRKMGDKKCQTIAFRADQLKAVEALALARGLTTSDALRAAVDDWLTVDRNRPCQVRAAMELHWRHLNAHTQQAVRTGCASNTFLITMVQPLAAQALVHVKRTVTMGFYLTSIDSPYAFDTDWAAAASVDVLTVLASPYTTVYACDQNNVRPLNIVVAQIALPRNKRTVPDDKQIRAVAAALARALAARHLYPVAGSYKIDWDRITNPEESPDGRDESARRAADRDVTDV